MIISASYSFWIMGSLCTCLGSSRPWKCAVSYSIKWESAQPPVHSDPRRTTAKQELSWVCTLRVSARTPTALELRNRSAMPTVPISASWYSSATWTDRHALRSYQWEERRLISGNRQNLAYNGNRRAVRDKSSQRRQEIAGLRGSFGSLLPLWLWWLSRWATQQGQWDLGCAELGSLSKV